SVEKNAPARFNSAAMIIAFPGERVLVPTTVAMAFAVSCQPFVKSKISASKITKISNHNTSGILHNHAFHHIHQVFKCIDHFLQTLINLLHFDQMDGILWMLEKLTDAFEVDLIAFIF